MADSKNMTLRLDTRLADREQAAAEVEGSTASSVVREALAEHVERRRSDPRFQAVLERNLQRHRELLSLLADG